MLVDMHVHTKEVSACGKVEARRVVRLYAEKGYDAVVITNHLNGSTRYLHEAPDWDAFIDSYLAPVREARDEGEKVGVRVFWGVELRFENGCNDYLLYGISEETLRAHSELRTLKLKQLRKLADEEGFLIFQAHPFRTGMVVCEPALLDGIEVANGHPRHRSRNDFARLWADVHGLKMTAGSDFHEEGDEARGGLLFFRDIADERELAKALRDQDFRLIVSPTGGIDRHVPHDRE